MRETGCDVVFDLVVKTTTDERDPGLREEGFWCDIQGGRKLMRDDSLSANRARILNQEVSLRHAVGYLKRDRQNEPNSVRSSEVNQQNTPPGVEHQREYQRPESMGHLSQDHSGSPTKGYAIGGLGVLAVGREANPVAHDEPAQSEKPVEKPHVKVLEAVHRTERLRGG